MLFQNPNLSKTSQSDARYGGKFQVFHNCRLKAGQEIQIKIKNQHGR